MYLGLNSQAHCRLLGRAVFLFLFCVCLPTHRLIAQTDLAGISGSVADTSGASVPGCTVTLHNLRTSAVRTVRSGSDGRYMLPSLTVGDYEVSASMPGFESETSRVELSLSGVTVNFRIHPGKVTDHVEVIAESGAVAVQKDTFEISQSLGKAELESVASTTDSLIDMVSVAPATQTGTDSGNELGIANHFGVAAKTIIVAGLGNAHNLYLQDGIDNVNLLTATVNILASRASTQEVNLLINGGSARFSQPSTFNVITKGGSNHFHGMIYDYLQNDFFDARNWFSTPSTPTPTLRYNYYGANLGGPVLRNKLFVFFDYSGQRSESASPSINRVPTLAERSGDFSADGVIYDPLTFNTTKGTSAFAGNMIPGSRISSFAQSWLALYPLPNMTPSSTSDNYTANLTTTDNYNRELGRLDWNISTRDQMFASFARIDENTGTNTISPGLFGIYRPTTGTNISVGETHILTTHMVNVAKVGYNRANFFRRQQGQSAKNYANYFGLGGVAPPASQSNPPKLTITNYTSFGDFQTPEGTVQNRYQLADEVTVSRGKHDFYFGVEFIRTHFDGSWTNNNNGTYTLDGSATSLYNGKGTRNTSQEGNGLADLLLGFPNSAQVANGTSIGAFRQFEIDGYMQDAWRLLPKLTLNAGLRYQFSNPPQDKDNRAGLFDIKTTGISPGIWNANYNDWGPRVGLAWSPWASTSIRTGFGIYYSPIQYYDLYLALQYAPNFVTSSYTFNIAHPINIQQVFTGTSTAISDGTIAKRMKDESAEEWNLSVEQGLGKQTLLTVAYIGDISRHYSARGDFNQPYALTPGNTSGKLDLRPQPNYGPILGENNGYNANYHGLAVRLQQSSHRGFNYLASYTYSRAMSVIDGDNNNIENIYQPHLDYAPASFDRAHNFQLSGTYHLPFGPGQRFARTANWYNREVIGGWAISGVQWLATGQPVSITANANADADSTSTHPVFAQKICNPQQGFTKSQLVFYNAACFVQPATGQYGTARNAVRQPGIVNTNVSAFKIFPIEESVRLQFRADAFSIFNHPNLSTGGSNKGFTNQPLLTAETVGQRTFQFQLALLF
jgi:Carboxypeptidase regulatory-like domain/TonB dependent receptor